MVVGFRELVSFIKQCRIEDKIYLLVDQPHDMSVCELCRIAFGFARNGLNAKLIDLTGRAWREYDTISQLGKEGIPERIVFVHI